MVSSALTHIVCFEKFPEETQNLIKEADKTSLVTVTVTAYLLVVTAVFAYCVFIIVTCGRNNGFVCFLITAFSCAVPA